VNRYPDTPSTARRRKLKAQKAKRPAHLEAPPPVDAAVDAPLATLPPLADAAHGRQRGAGNALTFFVARKGESSDDDE
jgi:hypothetical protein